MSRQARGTVVTVFDGAAAESELDRVADAYATVYQEPPYQESESDFAEFRQTWERRRSAPGFRLVTCVTDHVLAGFAFGHGLQPDTRWWSGVRGPELDPRFITENTGRTFAIIELAVLPEFRRREVGRTLQAQLLAGIPHTRATLLVRPDAVAAVSFYVKSGYRRVAAIQPYDGAPVYDAMVLEPPVPAGVPPPPG